MPVVAKAASVMCSACGKEAGPSIAAMGSMSVGLPSTSVKPVGAFIQAFAKTTKMPETVPLTATATPAHQCARAERRVHP
jgi:hypothetical protein